MASLLDPRSVRAAAERLGLRPTKALGQNFVVDANTVRRIVALGGVDDGDTVLEIGPGLGSLTLGLLATGASVTAVEIDPRLAGQLPATVAEHQPQAAGRLRVVAEENHALASVVGLAHLFGRVRQVLDAQTLVFAEELVLLSHWFGHGE